MIPTHVNYSLIARCLLNSNALKDLEQNGYYPNRNQDVAGKKVSEVSEKIFDLINSSDPTPYSLQEKLVFLSLQSGIMGEILRFFQDLFPSLKENRTNFESDVFSMFHPGNGLHHSLLNDYLRTRYEACTSLES